MNTEFPKGLQVMQVPMTTTYKYPLPFRTLLASLKIPWGLCLLFFTATYAVNPPLCSPAKDKEWGILLDL